MTNKIKLFDVFIDHEESTSLQQVLKSRFWASGAGIGKVLEFENKFNKYLGSDSCIAVNSGTAALHLALSLIDVKNQDILIPSFSFISTAHAVIYNGARPIFVDIDPETLCMDPQAIKKSITEKAKVILPIHYAGRACNIDEIIGLCENNNLHLIEDAAHAAGASYKNKKIGKHGMAVCFSFHPVKNLAMPTGGAITLNGNQTGKFRKILESRRWCGIFNRKGAHYDVKELGWNYYMNEFSAAIGLTQLKKLDLMNRKRRKIAKRYSKEIELANKMRYNDECSYHLYWIQVKNRSMFMKKMAEKNIETGIHYLPIHKMTFYKGKHKLPVTEKISKEIVSIPMHPNLTENDVSRIIKTINELT